MTAPADPEQRGIGARITRAAIGVVVAVVALVLAFWIWIYLPWSPWHPTEPEPPTAAQLATVAARFPDVRDTLPRILDAERAYAHRWHVRDSLRNRLLATGDTSAARRVDDQPVPPPERPGDALAPPFKGENIVVSDSLIYVSVWASRGRGFSAPHWYAGYVYATRPPADGAAWKAAGLGVPYARAAYVHIDGPWYLYSMHDPWGESGD